MTHHKTSVYIDGMERRFRNHHVMFDPIPTQVRYLIRLAVACDKAGTDYDLTWQVDGNRMKATIEAIGVIPDAKPLPKAPAVRVVHDWKPRIFEAEYRLESMRAPAGWQPGFVVEHSSGLSLTKAGASESGELESDGTDVRDNWSVTHKGSGMAAITGLKFDKAAKALLFLANALDWSFTEASAMTIEHRKRGFAAQAEYGPNARAREMAKAQYNARYSEAVAA